MKKLTIASLLVALIVVTLGASLSTSPEPHRGHFKNLKVLPKNISKDDLDSIMDDFTIALGVRCNFCHARKADTTKRGLDFASDKKKQKHIARGMLRMVNTLNTVNFNYMHSTRPDTIHTIICYTCHRGAKQPTSASLMPTIEKIKQQREMEWKRMMEMHQKEMKGKQQ